MDSFSRWHFVAIGIQLMTALQSVMPQKKVI
jgi:hypothetical protein